MAQSEVTALQAAYAAFSQGDFDTARQYLAPDIEWVESGRGMPSTVGRSTSARNRSRAAAGTTQRLPRRLAGNFPARASS